MPSACLSFTSVKQVAIVGSGFLLVVCSNYRPRMHCLATVRLHDNQQTNDPTSPLGLCENAPLLLHKVRHIRSVI